MRTYSVSLLREAGKACKWNELHQVEVVCNHVASIVQTAGHKIYNATKTWIHDSGIPTKLALISLCFMVDELEAEPGYKGDKFAQQLEALVEAANVGTSAKEKKKPEKAKTATGRGRKKMVTPAESEKPAEELPAEPTKVEEASATPECTDKSIKVAEASKPVDRVVLVGYLDKHWCESTKEWLASDKPLDGQKLGSLLARAQFVVSDDLTLYLDAINGRPKPGIDVYLRNKLGKSVATLDQPIRTYTERFQITHAGATYKVMPPSE